MDPKIILVLMVKDEGAILRRCLEAASPFVDAILISDTGSSDHTLDVARSWQTSGSKPLAVRAEAWRDFGHNRSASMRQCRAFCKELQWELETTFALVLDADMLFRCTCAKQLRLHLLAGGLSMKLSLIHI